MGSFVCNNAILQCSFGTTPVTLAVVDATRPKIQGQLMANIMDYVPLLNIKSFGMCQSMANPTVASATAAAMGVLTPMPCVPVVTAPWAPGATQAKVCNFQALVTGCQCMCSYGGVVSINYQGNASPATAE